MDLNTITDISRPHTRDDLPAWADGDAWLGGGTWLYSEPQTHLRRLVDLSALGWEPLVIGEDGLDIAGTCTIARLNAAMLPSAWAAGHLVGACCRALMASFKVWNVATVGGNLCMALPAGAMISLAAALDGTCLIWSPDGGERRIGIFDFIQGAGETALLPGEILRSIHLPASAFAYQAAFRQISLTNLGRSGALVIGTRPPEREGLSLTITAATPRPVRIEFAALPTAPHLLEAIEAALSLEDYFEDVHGRRTWRRDVTLHLAEEVRRELNGETAT